MKDPAEFKWSFKKGFLLKSGKPLYEY